VTARWRGRGGATAIRRGTVTSVKDLVAAIKRFIDGWNERCHPLVWTTPADEILTRSAPPLWRAGL
jgi:hypothetical protein